MSLMSAVRDPRLKGAITNAVRGKAHLSSVYEGKSRFRTWRAWRDRHIPSNTEECCTFSTSRPGGSSSARRAGPVPEGSR
jgi:hypothetical protein